MFCRNYFSNVFTFSDTELRQLLQVGDVHYGTLQGSGIFQNFLKSRISNPIPESFVRIKTSWSCRGLECWSAIIWPVNLLVTSLHSAVRLLNASSFSYSGVQRVPLQNLFTLFVLPTSFIQIYFKPKYLKNSDCFIWILKDSAHMLICESKQKLEPFYTKRAPELCSWKPRVPDLEPCSCKGEAPEPEQFHFYDGSTALLTSLNMGRFYCLQQTLAWINMLAMSHNLQKFTTDFLVLLCSTEA